MWLCVCVCAYLCVCGVCAFGCVCVCAHACACIFVHMWACVCPAVWLLRREALSPLLPWETQLRSMPLPALCAAP